MTEAEKPKTISQDTYLRAFALWALARHHNAEVDKIRRALFKELEPYGISDNSQVDDAIYHDDIDFDEALKREGIERES
jgi:hypothetical protein